MIEEGVDLIEEMITTSDIGHHEGMIVSGNLLLMIDD